MAESAEQLESRIEAAVAAGFRQRLLDRGLARGLIWNGGKLPLGAPPFATTLTEDLLDYAHTLIAMAVRLRTLDQDHPILERAFLVAGEAIEAAIHRGAGGTQAGFHRISAAIAFHLARYSARAFSLIPSDTEAINLAPAERVLVELLLRRFEPMRRLVADWLLDAANSDDALAARVATDDDFDEADAANAVLTSSFMRGLALFDYAVTSGSAEFAGAARAQLLQTAADAGVLHAVSHWWTATLASQLIDELWRLSLHQRVGLLPLTDGDQVAWSDLRRRYIQRLRLSSRAAIELWPSQIEAACRALDPADDLVVALPTSAGKTRIAELCILRTLAADKRVVYVTPLRALSAQIERDLGDTFRPLGVTVSTLYGAAGIEAEDAEALRVNQIVVATPEKLDFALRNDNAIIDSVGLVVLDEGHMLGPNEREVRYEALVQRLLRRSDAGARRLVCLSALFPTPAEMKNLTAWLRDDEEGEPIHSRWRPTRQRFGVLRWTGAAARLEVKVEQESPYVPRFVDAVLPPAGSRRRKAFPGDKNELTLAAAWKFVEQGKKVMIYCALRGSVEVLGREILTCLRHQVLTPLTPINQRIRDAMATGVEWLGADHPAVQCLQYGIALHHGGLPRQYLSEVERLMRSGDCPLVIASPTLAQGLNLSASVLLVPSIWRNQEMIPPAEFANVAGRAGRAFVDVEGLVIHVVWDRPDYSIRNWDRLVREARAPSITSGILELAVRLYNRLAEMTGTAVNDLLDYITGQDTVWDFRAAKETDFSESDWERDVASLDSAVLALLEAETETADLPAALDSVLERSLFARQLEEQQEVVQRLIRRFIDVRATTIWQRTSVSQRRGYHSAGVGLKAGQFLDAQIDTLIDALLSIEAGVILADVEVVADATLRFAGLALNVAPFTPPKGLPKHWLNSLDLWMRGAPSASVIATCGDDGVDVLQEAFTYRLPWAMEAVRVHGMAVGAAGAAALTGVAALAAEAGSHNRSVMTLLRAGLNSREGAIAAVEKTAATFDTRNGMLDWLRAEDVQEQAAQADWPTATSRHAWLQFLQDEDRSERREWSVEVQSLPVKWDASAPPEGTPLVVEGLTGSQDILLLSPTFERLGRASSAQLKRPRRQILSVVANAPKAGSVAIEFFGP